MALPQQKTTLIKLNSSPYLVRRNWLSWSLPSYLNLLQQRERYSPRLTWSVSRIALKAKLFRTSFLSVDE
jgi:hypothetical protein